VQKNIPPAFLAYTKPPFNFDRTTLKRSFPKPATRAHMTKSVHVRDGRFPPPRPKMEQRQNLFSPTESWRRAREAVEGNHGTLEHE
jgi:hypothetical protein